MEIATPEPHAEFAEEFKAALKEVISHRPWETPSEIEKAEQSGSVYYEFVTNDESDSSLIQLLQCKCLFGRQLPKMPKEYISRLVFDRRHACLVMKRREPAPEPSASSEPSAVSPDSATMSAIRDPVLAAVCFRSFGRFAEIAFLAVSSKEQVRGYGTRLMNQLKQSLKTHGITDLVTYADNAAVGYFTKQGFYSPTPEQSTKTDSKWHQCVKSGYEGYIKDYDGANKMVCCIYPSVDYLTLSAFREETKAAIWKLIQKKCPLEVYPGLKSAPARVYDIPGLDCLAPHEDAPPRGRRTERQESIRRDSPSPDSVLRQRPVPSRLQVPTSVEAMVNDVLELALSSGHSWPFREPVDVNLAPDYYQVVKSPIDISAMRAKNHAGTYKSLSNLREDFELMLDNCVFYNGDDSVYAKAAEVLYKSVTQRIERLERMKAASR